MAAHPDATTKPSFTSELGDAAFGSEKAQAFVDTDDVTHAISARDGHSRVARAYKTF